MTHNKRVGFLEEEKKMQYIPLTYTNFVKKKFIFYFKIWKSNSIGVRLTYRVALCQRCVTKKGFSSAHYLGHSFSVG